MNSREQSSPPPEGALVVGVDGSDRDPLVLDAAIDAATRRGLPVHRGTLGHSQARPSAPPRSSSGR